MSPQFYRLLWKEYRAQRSLWLVLAFCMLALQTTIVVARPPATTYSTFRHAFGILMCTQMIVCCFCVTSIALLFSGEEDLGTAIWLRQFPVRTRTLFWSKAVASFFGALGMVILGLASTAILVIPRYGRIEFSSLNDPSLVLFAVLPVVIFVVSLFWSLQCRTVFMALGLSCASVFTGVLLATSSDGVISLRYTFGALAIVGLTLYPLAIRWHRGLRAVQPRPVGARLSRIFTAVTPPARIMRIIGVFAAVPVLAAIGIVILLTGIYLPWLFASVVLAGMAWAAFAATRMLFGARFGWKAWLKSAASTSPLRRRTTSVLLWREFRFAFPFAVIAIGLGVLATVGRFSGAHDAPWGIIVLAVVALECGLRTFRHDQQKLHGLFWSQRGVSPLLVWGVRNFVWLGTLLVVAALVIIIDLPQVPHRHWTSQERIIDTIIQVTQPPGFVRSTIETPLEFNLPRILSVWLAWLFGGFFLSQLCSCWISKPLIAFFIAATTFGTYTAWGAYSLVRDVPPILALWPVVLLAVAAVLLSRRDWMDRRFSFWIATKRIVFLLIPLLCLWPATAAWRMFQVPRLYTWLPTSGVLTNEAFAGYTVENQQSRWAQHWDALDLATQPLREARLSVELDAEQLQQAKVEIDEIWRHRKSRQLPPKWKLPWANYPAQQLAFAAWQQASADLTNGNPIASLTGLVKGVQLLQYLQGESSSWDQYHRCQVLQQQLLHLLHRVAAADRLTDQQLKAAADDIFAVLTAPVTVERMLVNRQVVYWYMLRREGYLWETEKQNISHDEVFAASFPERMRFLTLMELSCQWTLGVAESTGKLEMRRWAFTTITEPSDLLIDPVFSRDLLYTLPYANVTTGPLVQPLQQQLITAQQATWVILQLQAYRRQHGEFPESVSKILPTTSHPSKVHEAIRQQFQFRYAKSGLNNPADGTGQYVTQQLIPAGQPILWSPDGDSCLDLSREVVARLQATDIRFMAADPNRIVYLAGSAAVPSIQP